MSHTIGIDVGGTFTDFVLTEAGGGELRVHKSPSTPSDPSDGVVTGLRELAALQGQDLAGFLASTSMIVHGTTVTTNAVLTERGARTGLLTTEGFRDVLEMRRGVRSRTHLYDNKYVAPPPLVPRYLRLPVRERVDAAGTTLTDLDRDGARAAVQELLGLGAEAIAVCFMHAYADDAHEREVADMVRELAPDVFLSVSSEVLPQVRLYERVSTTAMNAYVGPVLRRYIERLVERLAEEDFGGVLLVMQSNGGVAIPEIVTHIPASTVLSGPAGGPVAGLAHARAAGSEDCLIVDMGGTSYDVSLVRAGEVQVTHSGEVNRHSVSLPMIDVHTIGAGGGSIGWLDEGGLLHMGPQSAGAEPGPAAYGRGGTEPTCTDADVVLGYIDPGYFLGGRMPLRVDLAQRAIEERIAAPLGLGVVEAAAAMYDVINLVMAAGTKDMTLARGVRRGGVPARRRRRGRRAARGDDRAGARPRHGHHPRDLVGPVRAGDGPRRPAPRLRPGAPHAVERVRSRRRARAAGGDARAGVRRARPRGRRGAAAPHPRVGGHALHRPAPRGRRRVPARRAVGRRRRARPDRARLRGAPRRALRVQRSRAPARGHRAARGGPRDTGGARPAPAAAGGAATPSRAIAPRGCRRSAGARRSRSTTATAWPRARRSPGRRSWSARRRRSSCPRASG